ncbi:serine/threonine protein kinase [Psychrobacter sp. AOP22-C1-C5]|uniref:serine/threonine protein kinase n=1 Tax=Psychrobacter sp. AOP22-C1-C5 TaxID=3457716 RepID=UPI004035C177
MKNSASHSSIIQALQAQARALLPTVTQVLSILQYREIAHQRLSQQNAERDEQMQDGETQSRERNCYQGLTRAQHSQFGHVMVKWQLNHNADHYSTYLSHEAHVLKSLNNLSQNQSNSVLIAPAILAHHELDVQVLEQGQHFTVLVMPYYSCGSLAKQLNRQTHSLLTDEKKYYFILQAAHLIAKLHQAGWLHNDIKPSNFLLNGDSIDEVCDNSRMPDLLMTDFALAHRVSSSVQSNPAGTPAYLAPERWHGQGATVQSDVYAFGIMMFEILMGKRPFKVHTQSSDPMIDWATQHCQHPIPRLPSKYGQYQPIVDSALAKRVEKRYGSMKEVLMDLERL